MRRIPVFSTRESILEALDRTSQYALNISAMYNSRLGGIIKDRALMSIHITDHMAIRGHSVFDTLSVIDGKTFKLQAHLDRLIRSANQARLKLPLPREELGNALKQLVASTNLRNCKLRYWISAGPGSVTVTPWPEMEAFYAIVFAGDVREGNTDAAKEFTSTIPLKPRLLATMKSTNYLLNALCAMESKDKGGYLGLQKNDEGFITEGPIANISFVLPGGRFVTPNFDDILAGTTVPSLILHARQLVEKGLLTSVEQRPIHIDEAKTCEEMFYSAADNIHPVLEWDGITIGEGKRGRIGQELINAQLKEFENPELLEEIPYNLYSEES